MNKIDTRLHGRTAARPALCASGEVTRCWTIKTNSFLSVEVNKILLTYLCGIDRSN